MRDLFTMAIYVIQFGFHWVTTLMTESGAFPLWIALFSVLCVYRFFIKPIIGSTTSAPNSAGGES